MSKIKDLTGKKFGMVTVIKLDKIENRRTYWICKCDCGNIFTRRSDIIQNKEVKSCGCYQKENNKIIGTLHGDGSKKSKYHRLYQCYQSMKQRCYNPNCIQFKDWGGRGIKVCDEWKNDYLKFKKWALSHGYRDDLTLDRIKVNRNYEPNNCRWITKIEQNRNTRKCKHFLINNKDYTIPLLSKKLGISDDTIHYWLKKGYDINYILKRFKNNKEVVRE